MNRYAVLAHPQRPQTFPLAERIANSLQVHGVTVQVFTDWQAADVTPFISPGCELVVAIGGDGAMLRAARVSAPHEVPVLGINTGRLGFLTEVRAPELWETLVDDVLAKAYWIEARMMLRAVIYRQDQAIAHEDALNDVVISGSVIGKMVELEAYIDGNWATTYFADAVIVATATGSTAYALASGGPILPPELKNILIVPSAPHLSMERPIVLSEGAQVEIRPTPTNRNDVLVTVDGIQLGYLQLHDRVLLQASPHTTRFVRMRGRNYFYRSLLDRLEPRIRRRRPSSSP